MVLRRKFTQSFCISSSPTSIISYISILDSSFAFLSCFLFAHFTKHYQYLLKINNIISYVREFEFKKIETMIRFSKNTYHNIEHVFYIYICILYIYTHVRPNRGRAHTPERVLIPFSFRGLFLPFRRKTHPLPTRGVTCTHALWQSTPSSLLPLPYLGEHTQQHLVIWIPSIFFASSPRPTPFHRPTLSVYVVLGRTHHILHNSVCHDSAWLGERISQPLELYSLSDIVTNVHLHVLYIFTSFYRRLFLPF